MAHSSPDIAVEERRFSAASNEKSGHRKWKSGASAPRQTKEQKGSSFVRVNDRTFFVTFVTHQRAPLFRKDERARLIISVLRSYEGQGRYELHAYVIMPDHVHLLMTPADGITIERAIQYVKGGFSFQLKKQEKWSGLIWQESFTQHRVRDEQDYVNHVTYIDRNPVRARLAREDCEYPYSSTIAGAKAPTVDDSQ